jgi:hypothetical protein
MYLFEFVADTAANKNKNHAPSILTGTREHLLYRRRFAWPHYYHRCCGDVASLTLAAEAPDCLKRQSISTGWTADGPMG